MVISETIGGGMAGSIRYDTFLYVLVGISYWIHVHFARQSTNCQWHFIWLLIMITAPRSWTYQCSVTRGQSDGALSFGERWTPGYCPALSSYLLPPSPTSSLAPPVGITLHVRLTYEILTWLASWSKRSALSWKRYGIGSFSGLHK